MKIVVLTMLIGIIVGFSSLPIRRNSKTAAPAAAADSISAKI